MPVSRVLHSHAPEECVYEPEGTGVMVKKGEGVCFTLRRLSIKDILVLAGERHGWLLCR
jgi:hypothetical protein